MSDTMKPQWVVSLIGDKPAIHVQSCLFELLLNIFRPSLPLLSYFVYARSEGSG